MTARHVLRTITLLAGTTGTVASLGACGGSSHRASSAATTTTVATTAAPPQSGLSRAARAMAAARSFRFSADVTRSGGAPVHLAGEFSAPDHLHQLITAAGQPPVEVVFIGNRGYRKRADGRWVEGTPPAGTSGPSDPGAAFDVVGGAADQSGSGTSYHFTLTGSPARRLDGAATKVEGTATVAGDTITELSYQGDDPGATKVTIRYSDIGSSPPVTAPKLG